MNSILSWVRAVLATKNFEAKIVEITPNQAKINGSTVEVRTATPTRRDGVEAPRYQFNVSGVDRTKDWFLLAGCITAQGLHIFYIPGGVVTGPTVQVTSAPWSYEGSYAEYLNNHNTLIEWIERKG